MIYAGIDIGSATTEVVLLQRDDQNGERPKIVGQHLMPTGYDHKQTAQQCFQGALNTVEFESGQVDFVVSTGYGRNNVTFADKKVTEIFCHGLGAHFCFPDARLVIDIGGQDSKVIKLSPAGKAIDFSMNDKCAAGTGRFIEMMARVLQVDLDQLGELSLHHKKDIKLSSICTVFAESEIISKISQGYSREDIAQGMNNAIVDRVYPMAKRLGIEKQVILTGGVAKSKGIAATFEKRIGLPVKIADNPQVIGALGAALYASQAKAWA